MKKAFALVMAVAMVMSLAAVSFATVAVVDPVVGSDATDAISTKFRTYDKDADKWEFAGDTEVFGTVLYLPLITDGARTNINTANADRTGYVTDSDAVKALKVDAKWTQNGDYVSGVEIVKVDGLYALAVTTTGSSVEDVEVLGEIAVKGKSYYEDVNGKTQKNPIDVEFDVELDLAYTLVEDPDVVSGMNVTTKKVYDFSDVEETEEFEITFTADEDIVVVTDVKNMKKVLLGVSTKDNEELVDAYVDANLDFYNCTATFRRTAEVLLYAEEGSYLYEINADGLLEEVDAEYDEWEEAFSFKTRKLGNYVVSDVELEVAEEVVVTNPSTGATA